MVITFTGDLSFSKYHCQSYKKFDLFDKGIKSFLSESDYCVVNMEGPVGVIENQTEFCHCSDGDCISKLMELGTNIWSLANNHALDLGGGWGSIYTYNCRKSWNKNYWYWENSI